MLSVHAQDTPSNPMPLHEPEPPAGDIGYGAEDLAEFPNLDSATHPFGH
jgi:hypothetical protein